MLRIDNIRRLLGSFIPVAPVFNHHVHREYLEIEILDFISRHKYSDRLILVGETALRLVYNNNRFAEKLEFHFKSLTKKEFNELADDILRYLEGNGLNVVSDNLDNTSLNLYGRDIIFPQLRDCGEDIHIRVEAHNKGVDYREEYQFISRAGFTFPVCLPPIKILCAMKVAAFLYKERGADLYDLTFLLGLARPDSNYLRQKLGMTSEFEMWTAIEKTLSNVDIELKIKDCSHTLLYGEYAAKLLQFKEMVSLELERIKTKEE